MNGISDREECYTGHKIGFDVEHVLLKGDQVATGTGLTVNF